MNSVCIEGKITKEASKVLVNNDGTETLLVTFTMLDTGLPYQKSSPMFIEVHFMKEAAFSIFPYLKKGKEILVFGCLRSKDFVTTSGEAKQKYFISVDLIKLEGSSNKKEEKNGSINENKN